MILWSTKYISFIWNYYVRSSVWESNQKWSDSHLPCFSDRITFNQTRRYFWLFFFTDLASVSSGLQLHLPHAFACETNSEEVYIRSARLCSNRCWYFTVFNGDHHHRRLRDHPVRQSTGIAVTAPSLSLQHCSLNELKCPHLTTLRSQ